MRDIDRGELRAPALVLDLDTTRSYGDAVVDVTNYATAWCLIRRDGIAVATRFLDVEAHSAVGLNELRDRFAGPDLPTPVVRHDAAEGTLTVVICTRDRREGLLVTLDSLAAQTDPDFEVLVVDNSESGEIACTLTHFDGVTMRCYHEPAPGLSRARNRALREVRSDFIAWIDDDEVADPEWVAWIKRGFAMPGQPQALSGVMLPAELETTAQVNFEQYGGFNKGRGMEPIELRKGTPAVIDPLYPLPNFGAGGNMAFKTSALRAIGGFDNRLGAGTLTHGGDETRALSLILESGAMILHWPPAVTWHFHRRTDEALESQFFGYSAGLTAFYMSILFSSPKYIWRIFAFIPLGVRRILAQRTDKHPDDLSVGFPEHLLRASRRGLLRGAWLYVRESVRQSRSDRAARRA